MPLFKIQMKGIYLPINLIFYLGLFLLVDDRHRIIGVNHIVIRIRIHKDAPCILIFRLCAVLCVLVIVPPFSRQKGVIFPVHKRLKGVVVFVDIDVVKVDVRVVVKAVIFATAILRTFGVR